jgi:DNA-binding PucR family transcriptional regulator
VVAAERLGVHVNPVHNRLERVAALRGQPHLGPAELLELAAAIRICRRGGG